MRALFFIFSSLSATTFSNAAPINCIGVVNADSIQINHNGTIDLGLESSFDGTTIPANLSLDALPILQYSLLNNVEVTIKGYSDSDDSRCLDNSKPIEFLSISLL